MRTLVTRLAALAAGALAALPALAPAALAQAWPNRPITLIVPFAAGGGTDAFARPLAAQLDQQLGVRVLIENRAGAGGTVGAGAAAKAAPDGYTFLVGATHHAIAPSLYPKLAYDLERDLVPVAMIARVPHVVVANPGKVKAANLAELVAFAKANPGKLNYGSAGGGTAHHLAGELFKMLTGTNIVHVAYRGAGPALQDLVAGQIDLVFDGLGSASAQIQGGTVKALAVAAQARSPALPDVPTATEAGVPGYEVSTFYALWAPKGTPPDLVERVTAEVRKALDSPAVREAWARQGSEIPTLTGAAFGAFVSQEVARWGKVVKEAGVKLEQ